MNDTDARHRRILFFSPALFCIILFVSVVQAADITATFSWLPNQETDLAGYEIHYGTTSHTYDTVVDIGNPAAVDGRIQGQVTGLTEGTTYYFAVIAYNTNAVKSDYSTEVMWTATTGTGGGNPPTASDSSLSTAEDQAASGSLNATNDSGLTITYLLQQDVGNGTLSLQSDTGNFSYTPLENFAGTDSFTFLARDDNGDSNIATVAITITPVNDAPVAEDGSISTNENTAANGQLQANDQDGDALTFAVATNPTKGNVTIASSGSFTYTPDTGITGTDSFTFKANDGTVDSAPATVSITINNVNDPPTAASASIITSKDTTVNGQLQANDPDGDSLTYTVVTNPVKGSLTISADSGSFSYAPHSGEAGTDSFSFKVNDGTLDSATATVTITIDATTAGVTFTWNPNAGEIDGYKLYYKTGPEGGPEYNGTGINEGDSPINVGTATSYTVTGLQLGETYYFTITTFRGQDESSFAGEIRYRPGAPHAPQIISIKKTQ